MAEMTDRAGDPTNREAAVRQPTVVGSEQPVVAGPVLRGLGEGLRQALGVEDRTTTSLFVVGRSANTVADQDLRPESIMIVLIAPGPGSLIARSGMTRGS